MHNSRPILLVEDDHADVMTVKRVMSGLQAKPMNYTKFVEMFRTIVLYWSLSELPDDK